MSNIPTVLSTGWRPPPVSQVNLHDCEKASTWLGKLAQAGLEFEVGKTVKLGPEASFNVTIPYLRSIVPPNWSAPHPSDADLAVWYIDVWTNDTLTAEIAIAKWDFAVFAARRCLAELCKSLDWQGDADVSGRGMMISYYIAAGLTTIYFAVLVTGRLLDAPRAHRKSVPGDNHDLPRPGWSERLYASFAKYLDTFLDAALIFNVAMLMATIYRYSSVLFRHPEKPASLYSLYASAFMSTFSTFPPIILSCLAERLRRRPLKQFLWLLVFLFSITANGMAINLRNFRQAEVTYSIEKGPPDFKLLARTQDYLWATACDEQDLWRMLQVANWIGLVVLLANGFYWCCYTVAGLVPRPTRERTQAHRLSQLWKRWRPFVRVANAMLCSCLTWVFLALFVNYRKSLEDRTESVQDHEWTFGQILALATWAPSLFDLFHIVRYVVGHEVKERLLRTRVGNALLSFYVAPTGDEGPNDGHSDDDSGHGSDIQLEGV